jgi:hypothetical protein
MKKVLCVVVLICFAFNVEAQKTEALKWLVGTWKINTGHGYIVEKWKILNDSTLSGKSAFIKTTNDTIPQESMELSHRKGQWSYVSTVQGQNNNRSVSFKLIFLKDAEFICENLKHDFPQRISYRRIKNQLFASIEGTKNGHFSKQNFDFSFD